jgi:hypothetical protein
MCGSLGCTCGAITCVGGFPIRFHALEIPQCLWQFPILTDAEIAAGQRFRMPFFHWLA